MLRLASLSLSLPLSIAAVALTGCSSTVISGPELDEASQVPELRHAPVALADARFDLSRAARPGRFHWLGSEPAAEAPRADSPFADAGAARGDAGSAVEPSAPQGTADAGPGASADSGASPSSPSAPSVSDAGTAATEPTAAPTAQPTQAPAPAPAAPPALAPAPSGTSGAGACPCACGSAPTAARSSTAIPSVLHFPLNRESLDDASGRGAAATATNGTRFAVDPTDGRLAWRSGGTNRSAVRVTIPGWGIAPKAQDYAVSLWARTEDFVGPGANVSLVSSGLNVALGPSWYASVPFVQASGSWYPFGGGAESSRLGPSGSSATASDWWNVRYHMITVVWHRTSSTRGVVRTFRDATHIAYEGESYAASGGDQPFGTDVGHLPADDVWNGAINSFEFGAGGPSNAVYVRDLRFFDRALSDTEVATLYAAGMTR